MEGTSSYIPSLPFLVDFNDDHPVGSSVRVRGALLIWGTVSLCSNVDQDREAKGMFLGILALS